MRDEWKCGQIIDNNGYWTVRKLGGGQVEGCEGHGGGVM